MHVSEQPQENAECQAEHGCTPTALLAATGCLERAGGFTAVHAIHLERADFVALAGHNVCACPTTEADLGDGIIPAGDHVRHGVGLALGSDSNAVIDLFEEARGVELDERLASERRGHWPAVALLRAATGDGHASLGWAEAGRLEVGALADFITVALGSVRLAGARPPTLLESLVFAAGAPDVQEMVVGGRRVVSRGRHTSVGDVAAALDSALAAVLP
jgi:cytosine/adenosine deaminase-related metal-dependent hydrolase